MDIEVTYMSGAGNLFSAIDNRIYKFNQLECSLIAGNLCNKNINKFMTTEGLLVIEDGDDSSDFTCYFFNPDGTYNMMCGNGGRCALLFALANNFIDKAKMEIINFNMQGTKYSGRILVEKILGESYSYNNSKKNKSVVELFMPPPNKIVSKMNLTINDEIWNVSYIDVNSDHVVVNMSEIEILNNAQPEEFDIMKYGKLIRYNEALKPKGANANFYRLGNDGKIYLRTYERGVEMETGACGTGAVSTAIAAVINEQEKYHLGNKLSHRQKLNFPVTIIPSSKSPLVVDILGEFPDGIESIILRGEAEIIGSGSVFLENIGNNDNEFNL